MTARSIVSPKRADCDQILPSGYAVGYDRATLPPMTRAEECAAFEALRAGNLSQRDLLARANLRFAIQQAARFQGRGLEMDDLVQEAVSGLLLAIDRFDHTRGLKLISYAIHWIRQAVQAAVGQQTSTVRLPPNIASVHRQIYRHIREQETAEERSVSSQEAIEDLGLPIFAQPISYMSLDAPKPGHEEGNDRALHSNTTRQTLDRLSIPAEDHTVADQLRKIVRQLMQTRSTNPFAAGALTEREQLILTRYFGLDGLEPLTLEQIGAELGLTRERVRQVKEVALGKLRARVNSSRAEIMEMVE